MQRAGGGGPGPVWEAEVLKMGLIHYQHKDEARTHTRRQEPRQLEEWKLVPPCCAE